MHPLLFWLQIKIPLSLWISVTSFPENLLTDAAPLLCQYFQNVQISKQDLTGCGPFFEGSNEINPVLS